MFDWWIKGEEWKTNKKKHTPKDNEIRSLAKEEWDERDLLFVIRFLVGAVIGICVAAVVTAFVAIAVVVVLLIRKQREDSKRNSMNMVQRYSLHEDEQ